MKIATTKIDVETLGKLRARGPAWFNWLCQNWQQRTGYEPVCCEEHVARVAARKKRWTNWPIYLLVLVLVPLLLRRFFISSDEGLEGAALAFGTLFIFVCFAVSRIAEWKCNDGSRMYPRSALQFSECLSYFLTSVAQTPDQFRYCGPAKLKELAEKLLMRKVYEFIVFERTPLDVRLRMQQYSEHLESLKQEYKETHRYLLDLGLVRPDIGHYFRKAEKELDKVSKKD